MALLIVGLLDIYSALSVRPASECRKSSYDYGNALASGARVRICWMHFLPGKKS
jgi:hypothetical protein